jgi:hypothetical protein
MEPKRADLAGVPAVNSPLQQGDGSCSGAAKMTGMQRRDATLSRRERRRLTVAGPPCSLRGSQNADWRSTTIGNKPAADLIRTAAHLFLAIMLNQIRIS